MHRQFICILTLLGIILPSFLSAASLGTPHYSSGSGGMRCLYPLQLLAKAPTVNTGVEEFKHFDESKPRFLVQYPFIIERPEGSKRIWIPLSDETGMEPVRLERVVYGKVGADGKSTKKLLHFDLGKKKLFFTPSNPDGYDVTAKEIFAPSLLPPLSRQLKSAAFKPLIRGFDEFLVFASRNLKVLAMKHNDEHYFLAKPLAWQAWQDPKQTEILGANFKSSSNVRERARLVLKDPLRLYEIDMTGEHQPYPRVLTKDIDDIQASDLFNPPHPSDLNDGNPYLHWLSRNVSFVNETQVWRLLENLEHLPSAEKNLERLAKILFFVKQGFLGQEGRYFEEEAVTGGAFQMAGHPFQIHTRVSEKLVEGLDTNLMGLERTLSLYDSASQSVEKIPFRWRLRRP